MANASTSESKPTLSERITTFYQEVRSEMDKVTWPSNEDLKLSTTVTMYMILLMALVVFVLDSTVRVVVFTILSLG